MKIVRKLSYVFSLKQKMKLLLIFVMIVLGAFLELLGVTVILPFVNAILSPETITESQLFFSIYRILGFTDDKQFILFLVLCVISIYILKNVYIAFMYDVQYRFTFNNQRRLAVKMMNCYIRQPYYFHLSHGSGEMIQNITDDSSMFFAVILAAMQFITEIIVCIVLIVFLFFQDPFVTMGVALVMCIFLLIYFGFLRRKIQAMGGKYRKCNQKMNKHIIEGFSGIKEIKVLNRESYFVNAYDESYQGFAEAFRKFQTFSILPRPLMEAICISGLMSVVAIKLASGEDMSYFVPMLSVFVVAAFRMLPSFSRITSHLSTIVFNRSAVESVYRDLKEIEDLSTDIDTSIDTVTDLSFEQEIEIKNLSFSYPETQAVVLNDISLRIIKNTSTAFIGPSGQGKTTLADLILGILQPTKGQIYVDGYDIQSNMRSWHMKIGYIPQSIFLTDDTIRKNIAFGIQEANIDDEAVWRALEEAQLKTFVESLDKGLDTEVGERGVRLSGGQRQRIGIARALYHDPQVLMLDEATSALDNETETAVMEAIDILQGNKTLIIIAHRLSTIKNCEYVYEINHGKVERKDKV